MLNSLTLQRSAGGLAICSLLFAAVGPVVAFALFHATGQVVGFFDIREVDWRSDWPTLIRILSAFYMAGAPIAAVTGLLYGGISMKFPPLIDNALARSAVGAFAAELCAAPIVVVSGAGVVLILTVAAVTGIVCAQLVTFKNANWHHWRST